jgi:ubiquitin carboxyl-terminal hydrolase L3
MVPQPVKAVVLLFPITEKYEELRKEEDAKIAKEGQHPVDPTILWIKQTVRSFLLYKCFLHVDKRTDR